MGKKTENCFVVCFANVNFAVTMRQDSHYSRKDKVLYGL